MENDIFNKLPKEYQVDYIKMELGYVFHAVSKRMEILLLPSGVTATLFAVFVASFSNNFLSNVGCFGKVIISILVMIIPISLILYNRDMRLTEKQAIKRIEKALSEDFSKELGRSGILNKITAYFPDTIICILSITAIWLIYKIWF